MFKLFSPKPPRRSILLLDGLSIQVTRKAVRTLRLSVVSPQDGIRLSVPLRLGDGPMKAFVQSKLTWIRLQQERLARLAEKSVAGESPALQAERRRALKALIPPLIARWQPRLGVNVEAWAVRSMRTRWGSCNTRARRLSFSLELAKRTPECLEYIVVHEMLHLLEAGHGPRFKALMDQHYPAWKRCRAQLNGKEA